MSRTRLLLPLILFATFALPAAADASFQARIIDKTHVSITGTDDAEAIVIGADAFGRLTHDQTSPGFASALDFDTSLPGTQMVGTLPVLTVDAEGGDDRIEVTTKRVTLSADAGEGDDIVYGSPRKDVIQGGLGDDYVAGLGGADEVFLGSGDDDAHWTAATDAGDAIDGGEGNDTVDAWGSQAADEFNVWEQLGGVNVTAAGGSRLDTDAVETLSLPLFGGDDIVTTELVPASVRLDVAAGAGDDDLSGGAGPDDLSGGEGNDRVSGYGGDDTLSGETVVGDVGNDRMNLDAPGAYAEGDEGYDITTVGATGGDDSISIAPQSGLVKIQGAGPAAFTDADGVVVQAGAGNDLVTVQPGTGTLAAISVSGGPGDDTLLGSDGLEHLSGSSGQDVLDGGLAPDLLGGSSGDDVIRARDRAADTIACDQGNDVVLADLGDLDQLAGCEQSAPAAATGPVPLARVAGGDELRLGGAGTVKVPVACSAGARGGCQGTLTLVSTDTLTNGSATPLRIAKQNVSLAPGTTADVEVPIPEGEDLARAFGTRQLTVQAQVLTGIAEHTTLLPLNILR